MTNSGKISLILLIIILIMATIVFGIYKPEFAQMPEQVADHDEVTQEIDIAESSEVGELYEASFKNGEILSFSLPEGVRVDQVDGGFSSKISFYHDAGSEEDVILELLLEATVDLDNITSENGAELRVMTFEEFVTNSGDILFEDIITINEIEFRESEKKLYRYFAGDNSFVMMVDKSYLENELANEVWQSISID